MDVQLVLFDAVYVASDASITPQLKEDPLLTTWQGDATQNPTQLECLALQACFLLRRDLLQHCGGSEVVVSLS